jgi:hypothetical protein
MQGEKQQDKNERRDLALFGRGFIKGVSFWEYCPSSTQSAVLQEEATSFGARPVREILRGSVATFLVGGDTVYYDEDDPFLSFLLSHSFSFLLLPMGW